MLQIVAVCSLRYNAVQQPSDSVVPPRFYYDNENINLQHISVLTAPTRRWSDDVDMLVVVRSATDHFERRDAIRLTWGKNNYTVYVFIFTVNLTTGTSASYV